MMDTRLTDDFWLSELLHSDKAQEIGDPNTPDSGELVDLTRLAVLILQPARIKAGVPIHVHDGFRDAAVNDAVHGVATSQHRKGQAADIDAKPTFTEQALFELIRTSDIPYDQVILEPTDHGGCVHVSVAPAGVAPRRQALIRHGAYPNWSYEEVS